MRNKGFFVFKLPGNIYCVGIYIDQALCTSDFRMAYLLDIEYSLYEELLVGFGAINDLNQGLIFAYEYEAQKLVDYLNEKYLLMLKLANKIK